GVVATNPVFPRWRKQGDDDAVLQRLGAMWNVWRNLQDLAGSHDLFHSGQNKPHGASLNHRDLLVVMAVLWYGTALSNIEARHGHCFSMNHLAHEQWIHLLFLDLVPFV